ncbi:type II secretion system F family protein [Streptomonospora nanhaiensis]|uniref:type II secretion system F family protein n=1 Tax=Streptomonospora nanhaiensis TaxID=1323731 RepID=UPI001C38FD26|nr:type II secretion system F family protein [Streptomonospora nanhaiensis]MBV2366924.1 type II secretion system F family protein [Streptomonospora nanhaiensis]
MNPGVTGSVLVAVCGAVAGAGLWVALAALASVPPATRGGRQVSLRSALLGEHRPLRLAGALGGGALVWAVTQWPVAGVLAALACWWLPTVLGPDRHYERHVAGVEAVAAWAEMLRDLMASASGLHQAISATVPIAPEPVRAEVSRLADDLRRGRSPQAALRDFADEVDNPTADLVSAALSTAASRHATDLGVLLGSLAEAARDQAAMLVRVAASRARVRTSTRIIIGVTLGMAALLLLFSPDYLAPFDSLLGQVVLAGIGAVWGTALVWMVRMARPKQGPRVLAPASPAAPAAEKAEAPA